MSIVVFWLEGNISHCYQCEDSQMKAAMDFIAYLRGFSHVRHVTLSTELAGMVGKPGVDSVENGKTPDGHIYDWDKKDRRRRS